MPQHDHEKPALEAALTGSVESFEPLVEANASRLIRLAYHFLGDWDEARDLAQETFARAYFCLDQYDPRRPFSAWLSTIAARLATDRLRRRRVRSRAEGELSRSPSGGGAPPGGLDAEATLSLREALDRLTPRQRQAVVLCDLHGFSGAEAAEMLGCSGSTIRVLRFLARRRLRETLSAAATPATEPVPE